jgi:stringent starvation protein B
VKRVRKKLNAIGRAIEDVLAAGHTPRLQIDARRNDVTVPDHVRARWGPRLIIDLDPSWPLALEHTKDALEVDLAFHGIVERCRLGWGSIYALVDRATGQGTVFRENLPLESLPPELRAPNAPDEPHDAAPPRMSLESVRSVPSPEPPEARETSPGTMAAEPEAENAPSVVPPSRPSSEEEAKARRARFRVIAGGG